jgi:cytochrome c oxidase subunit II
LSTALLTFAGLLLPDRGVSPNAEDIFELYLMLLLMSAVVFFVVEGLLIWFTLKYKARRGQVAAQIHGNTRLEVGWTIGAAVVLVFITAVTFIKLSDIKNPVASTLDPSGNQVAAGDVLYAATDQPPPPNARASLNIKVDGQQYVWRYQYPGRRRVYAYETMVVPVGTTVTLDISADDVMHAFWIPALGGKMDAVPGYVNKMWFQANEEGTYVGQCAELCGRNHANMFAQVQVVSGERYQQWYEQQAAAIQDAQFAGAEQRRELEESQGEQSAQGGGAAGGATDDQ